MVKAIILAAGRGSRMKHLTDSCPKGLVALRGKPLIEWQLAALREAGIKQIAIVTGYRRELFEPFGLKEFYNARWAETNMVSSLDCAGDWLELDTCIVSYSDIFYDASAVKTLIESSADIALTYDPNWLASWSQRFADPLTDAETFVLGPDGMLVEIGKTPQSLSAVQGQYMGLLRFTPRAWQNIRRIRNDMQPDERDSMHMTGTLQRIIEREVMQITPLGYFGAWGEIDSCEDLELYQTRDLTIS